MLKTIFSRIFRRRRRLVKGLTRVQLNALAVILGFEKEIRMDLEAISERSPKDPPLRQPNPEFVQSAVVIFKRELHGLMTNFRLMDERQLRDAVLSLCISYDVIWTYFHHLGYCPSGERPSVQV